MTAGVNLRILSIAVAVALGMLGAVQLASPESLGISPIAARWLGIVSTGLGILAGFLPRVQGPSKDPEVLADRIVDLPPHDRQAALQDIAERSGEDLSPTLADRIFALSPADRQALIDEVEHRALDETVGRHRPAEPDHLISQSPRWLPQERVQ
jgi:hypothetical protein